MSEPMADPHTTPVQPDLFGEYDAQQARARLAEQPATCPRCGTTEPNVHLLHQNHGQAPRRGHPCTAQQLVAHHIAFDAVRDDTDLARSVARGRELGLDTDAIIAQARQAATTE